MPRYSIVEVDSLTTILNEIEQYQQQRDIVWYRGINDQTRNLIPALSRRSKKQTDQDLVQTEKKISAAFSQRSPPFIDKDLSDPWRSLFFMQHYGIPTRLLDWSESPFVSLYFCMMNISRSKSSVPNADPALWLCDPVKWNRKALDHISFKGSILDETCEELKSYSPDSDLDQRSIRPIMIYGTHNSPRIVAQRGVFALFGKGLKSMEDVFEEENFPEDCLKKIVIKRTSVDQIMKSLFQRGVTESVVFPDLFGLSLEIKRMFGYK